MQHTAQALFTHSISLVLEPYSNKDQYSRRQGQVCALNVLGNPRQTSKQNL